MHHILRSTTAARKIGARALGVAAVALTLSLAAPLSATAAEAPVLLGTASTFGVLSGSAVTNTGPSVISGDLGVSPGSAITGFPPGQVDGEVHETDAVAITAQKDLETAYVDAAGRSATESGITELGGRSLTAGVYSGGELSLTGTLSLVGDESSVFIFQAASTITFASNSNIILSGGLTPCNVFWQATSSATLGSYSDVVGTVMALTSITANTGADVNGRLLAQNGAVTLDTNAITTPQGCNAAALPPVVTPPVVAPPVGAPPVVVPPVATPVATNPPTADDDSSVVPDGSGVNGSKVEDALAPTGASTSLLITAAALFIGTGIAVIVTVHRRTHRASL